MSNLSNLRRVIFLSAKYGLLIDISKKIKYGLFFKIASFIFYPKSLFYPKKDKIGERLGSFLESLGPIFIKFGQSLSTRSDIVGAEIAESLAYLQDSLPPFEFKEAADIVKKSLKTEPDALFSEFSEKPVAAASVAQVHKAKLRNGGIVAVKILRPDIKKRYKKDLNFLYFLAKIISSFPKARRLKSVEVVREFERIMETELDLSLEGANLSEARDRNSDENIYIPKIYWPLTEEKIMTAEWVDSISLYDKKSILKAKFDPAELAKKIAISFFGQAYGKGFFHADLHPGNIGVTKGGGIVLFDFGIVGRLEESERLILAEILYSFAKKDYYEIAKLHLKAGYIPKNSDLILFGQRCRALGETFLESGSKDFSLGGLLGKLFKITEDFGMETRPNLLLLQKTTLVVEGICKNLNPEANIWELVRPWVKKWARKNLSPEAKILRLLKNSIENFLDGKL